MTPGHGRDQDVVSGESLTRGGRPPRAFRRGRVCSAPGCRTRLSIYNSGDRCSLHEIVDQVRTRGVPAA
ncbi:MAG: hypothetical protein ACRDZQ_05955 [Acidimicrobiales bacterium]